MPPNVRRYRPQPPLGAVIDQDGEGTRWCCHCMPKRTPLICHGFGAATARAMLARCDRGLDIDGLLATVTVPNRVRSVMCGLPRRRFFTCAYTRFDRSARQSSWAPESVAPLIRNAQGGGVTGHSLGQRPPGRRPRAKDRLRCIAAVGGVNSNGSNGSLALFRLPNATGRIQSERGVRQGVIERPLRAARTPPLQSLAAAAACGRPKRRERVLDGRRDAQR